MATPKLNGIPVPVTLSSIYYKVGNDWIQAADIAKDQLAQDVPGSTNKRFSFTLDPTQRYQVSITVTLEGGILQTTNYGPETGVSDKSPNLPRNRFSEKFDTYEVFLLPPVATEPIPPPT